MQRFVGIIGLLFLIGVAYLLSNNRKAVKFKVIFWGVGLQVIFAFLVLKFPPGIAAIEWIANKITILIGYADKGSEFVFGPLSQKIAFIPGFSGFIFAFKVLPIIIFISSFFSVMYYLGVMQKIVYVMAKLMKWLMGISGAEALGAAANVFMGQTEAPLIIAPYIKEMTFSELLCLMVGGMATVSGSIMGAYIALGIKAKYLLSASVMAAPAAIMMAKLLVPETEKPKTAGEVVMVVEKTEVNIIDSASRGASQGAQLAINVAAMLVAFIAFIALADGLLGAVLTPIFHKKITLDMIFGYLFAPLAYIMGVPSWGEALKVGALFGKKLILNEYVAYIELAKMLKVHMLGPKAELISTYALCGFANIASIGIQIGGIGPLAPNKKHDIARLGLRALIGGSMATYMTATIAGIFFG